MAVPICILGIILVVMGRRSVSSGMSLEIQKSLAGIARETADLYSVVYPGEIKLENGHFYMGSVDLTDNYMLADRIKENTGADITILYGDIRMISTIRNSNGDRIVGTALKNQRVKDAVLLGNEYYSDNVEVWNENYFGYYIPLYNDDEICGMVFAGLTSQSVEATARTLSTKIVLAFLIVLLIDLAIISVYARNMVDCLNEIRYYIVGLAKNDFTGKMSDKVLNRKDEIGETGRHALDVGKVISRLISNDPLTGLYNRRAGHAELAKYMEKADHSSGSYVTIALGDIDFFKTVNDRYGHDCGDMVLVTFAEFLDKHMADKGFAVRWGGEEFLLVYRKDEQTALADLRALQEKLGRYVFTYEEYTFSVTMTFGLVEYSEGEKMDDLVKRADDLLYVGKEGGRNRIVVQDEAV
jgi:diguanylate cyclase (GGDEF)-like protein